MSAFRLAPAGLGLTREAALAPRRASAPRRGESRAAVLPRVVVHSRASRRASPSSSSSASRSARVVGASATAASAASAGDLPSQKYFSGLEGAALDADRKTFPTMAEVLSKIPKHCFVKDTWRSMRYAFISTALTVGCGVLAYLYLPLTLAFLPAWIAYAFVAGTCATGCWVVAHECGHGAFSDNKVIQDVVGYVLHSLLLVPYFSWQRSHAVHHSRTNHVLEGETHVPARVNTPDSDIVFKLRAMLGERVFTALNLAGVFLLGWPIYLLTGASGGPVRGATNHFNPGSGAKGKHALFPGKWAAKVWQSDVGCVAVVAALAAWCVGAGSVWPTVALYLGPYLVCNFWLVLYTWLQHTDVDVPHFEGEDWNLVKGAFMTIDRPYGPVLDFLHHRIGSTHVAHHVNHTIPHYHAKEATEALKNSYPDLYLYDPTPIATATWRVGSKCIAVYKRGKEWVFTDQPMPELGEPPEVVVA
jgi:omega-6 fatty acid desaturase (delta-12 desaturase)